MTELEAVVFGYNLLQTIGLDKWNIEISNRSVRRLGLCRYDTKTIIISKWVFDRIPVQVEDTMRHEIAHAVVGPGHGHNRKWKEIARLTGAKPVACVTLPRDVMVPKKWERVCPKCNVVTGRSHRKLVRTCVRCKSEVINRLFNPST